MAWTQTDIDALERAIAEGRGARSISFADQNIVFNSISEMLALLATMKQAVATAAGTPSTRYAAFSKGA